MNDYTARVLSARQGVTWLFSVGQAGYIVKSKSGQLLAIDMYLSECGERIENTIGFKRLLPRILEPAEIGFDVVIATHPHFDHFDMDSMPIIMSNPNTQLYASVDCEKEMDRLGMRKNNAMFVAPGDHQVSGDFDIDFINCDHGTGAPDAFGVIISVDGLRICETGDTCLRIDRASEYLKQGSLDILIGPINGAYGNMNEKDFATLCGAVKPKLAIPCHYGMFAAHGGNPGLFMMEMNEKFPDVNYTLLRMGEEIKL